MSVERLLLQAQIRLLQHVNVTPQSPGQDIDACQLFYELPMHQVLCTDELRHP